MQSAQVIALVRPEPGSHCDPRFAYHFHCPECGHQFCPGCYRHAGCPAGTVQCPTCAAVVGFATKSPTEAFRVKYSEALKIAQASDAVVATAIGN